MLRGDSTLRGHVFPETDAIGAERSVMLFVPAFPAGGRTMSMRWEGGCLLLPGGDRMKSTTG